MLSPLKPPCPLFLNIVSTPVGTQSVGNCLRLPRLYMFFGLTPFFIFKLRILKCPFANYFFVVEGCLMFMAVIIIVHIVQSPFARCVRAKKVGPCMIIYKRMEDGMILHTRLAVRRSFLDVRRRCLRWEKDKGKEGKL